MFGASHFQKEWSEKIDFWVSYSKNKFLKLQIDYKWLKFDYVANLNELIWLTNWLTSSWIDLEMASSWLDCKLTTENGLQVGCNSWLTTSWIDLEMAYKLLTGTAVDYRLTNRTADRLQVELIGLQLTTKLIVSWPTDYWPQMWLQLTTKLFVSWPQIIDHRCDYMLTL